MEHGKHIELLGVPRTATPADVRRSITRAGLQGVVDVAIDYHRFLPSGKALLTLNDPQFLRDNIRNLERLTVAGLPVKSRPRLLRDDEAAPSRMRGVKGRAEASERGIVTGNGPHAGITNCERHVVIKGLPGRISLQTLENTLRSYQLAETRGGRPRIVKVPLPKDVFTMYSRFLVTLKSEAEAHRLVRDLHYTYFDQKTFGTKHRLFARVVY
ncbi:hypothetical protein BDZ94DRAFT_1280997 [Collybia nuda]|uniref:RNA-binding protein n=1 Tax=Collybia nuda TaxID=64659 RepID=A0A9P5YCQ0_9AGAR|nr:hypothetical protein BDZ94DRAFT_1280997 [Collybia nuda]